MRGENGATSSVQRVEHCVVLDESVRDDMKGNYQWIVISPEVDDDEPPFDGKFHGGSHDEIMEYHGIMWCPIFRQNMF